MKKLFSRKSLRRLLSAALCVFIAVFFVTQVFVSCESMDSDMFGSLVGAAAGTFIDDKEAVASITNAASAAAKAGEGFTPEQEYYIGRAVAATLLQTYTLYSSPAFVEYLNEIVMTLAINSPAPGIYNGYHAAVLDSMEINAFATSGGHILVTRGLLAAAESEDALAAVLAHEMAHIQLGHSTKAIRSNRVVDSMIASANAAAVNYSVSMAEISKALGDSANDVVSTLVSKGYSQTQEYEADKYALSLMVLAGFDPQAMVEMLSVLDNRSRGSNSGFASTHPSAANRLLRVNAELKTAAFSNITINGRDTRNARYAKSKI